MILYTKKTSLKKLLEFVTLADWFSMIWFRGMEPVGKYI